MMSVFNMGSDVRQFNVSLIVQGTVTTTELSGHDTVSTNHKLCEQGHGQQTATLQTKLYGSPEGLRKTAAFVQETGVDN